MSAMPVNALVRRLSIDLLIIAAIGLVTGYIGPFGTFAMPIGQRIGYWLLFGLVGFALFRPMAPLARRLATRTGLPSLVAIGLVLLLPSVPMTALILFTLEGYHAGAPLAAAPLLQLYAQVWLLGALVFGFFLLLARNRDDPPAPEAALPVADAPEGAATPPLAARLPSGFGPILALKAEDHYVRVIGETGSLLLLMRLGDAVGEMDGVAGLRVHRSWWVASHAMDRLEPRGRGALLHLVNGEAAPVSRDNLAQVRAAIRRSP